MMKTMGIVSSATRPLCLCAVALGLAACADREATVLVSANSAGDDECSYAPENGTYFQGVLDTALRQVYVAHPLYESQLIDHSGSAPLRTNPNGVFIQGAEVELQDSGGRPLAFDGLPNPFTV